MKDFKIVFARALRCGFSAAMILASSLVPHAAHADATVTALHNFCQSDHPTCSDGSTPQSSLLRDSAGNLFGTTAQGGGVGYVGTVFEITASGEFKQLHSFCYECAEGQAPLGALIMDSEGNLYGTASNGGSRLGDHGTIFKLAPNIDDGTWKFSVIYKFCPKADCPAGAHPNSGLTYQGADSGAVWDGKSPLYGVTGGNGTTNGGNVFELDFKHGNSKPKLKVLHNFCETGSDGCVTGADGDSPIGRLAIDALGNIYGTTFYGGANGQGTVFELARHKKKYTESVLYSFCQKSNCADGANPFSSVIFDANGHLAGTTRHGGTHFNNGVAFSVTPAGVNSQETILHDFCSDTNCNDGAVPDAGLFLDGNGDLIGAAEGGGTGNGGVIYKLHGTTETVLYNFCQSCNLVLWPDAAVIQDKSGNLLGTTVGTGTNYGAVYKLTP